MSLARHSVVSLLVTLAAFAHGAAAQAAQGWTMGITFTIDSGMPAQKRVMTIQVHVLKNVMRMSMSGTALAGAADRMYMITNLIDSTLTTVVPSQSLAVVSDPRMATRAGAIKTELAENPKYLLEHLGAGENVLGYPTHHYRARVSYVIRTTFAGETCSRSIKSVDDIWTTTATDLSDVILAQVARISAGAPGTPSYAALLRSLQRDQVKGVTLRTISRSPRSLASDDSGEVTSTWEITELQRGQLDSALFAVPTDYRVTDTREPPPAADPAMLTAAMRDALRRNFCDPATKRP